MGISIIIGLLLEEYERLNKCEEVYRNKISTLSDDDPQYAKYLKVISKIDFNKNFIEKAFEGNQMNLKQMLFESWEASRWSNIPRKFSHP